MGLASTALATVALIVSLIALVVALGQLAQQVLGTADGYRQCKKTLPGSWGDSVHRHWLWSEFRFETKFQTPRIVLQTDQQFQMVAITKRRGVHTQYRLVNPNFENDFSWRAAEEMRMDVTSENDIDLTVTWVHFILMLRLLYQYYYAREITDNPVPELQQTLYVPEKGNRRFGRRHVPKSSERKNNEKVTALDVRNTITVEHRTLSWDFMSKDDFRPPAVARVKDIVVLAMRLGMTWRDLRMGADGMRADGNGKSLYTVSISGLGLGLRFDADHSLATEYPKAVIPSVFADKLMCGLLPGCPKLVKRDFVMTVQDEGGRSCKATLKNVLNALDAPQHFVFEFEQTYNNGQGLGPFVHLPFNDVVCLLMPFLPLEGSRIVGCQFGGWAQGWQQGPDDSIFHSWESRETLRHMDEYLSKGIRQSTVVQYVHDAFKLLATKFPHDFRSHYSWALISGRSIIDGHLDSRVLEVKRNKEPPPTTSIESNDPWELLRLLSQHHDYTTNYFGDLDLDFMHIVSAHFVMAHDACKRASVWVQHNFSKRDEHVAGLRDAIGGVDPYWGGGYPEKLELTRLYCDEHAMGVFHDALIHWRWYILDREKAEEIWWVLMLRGVTWDMSVRVENVEPTVHASIYENQTPVWIS